MVYCFSFRRHVPPAIGKNFIRICSTRIERLGSSGRHCVTSARNEVISDDMTNPNAVTKNKIP